MSLPEDLEETLSVEIKRLALKLDGQLRKDAVQGHYVERPHLPKKWTLSVYTSGCQLGTAVEFAIAPSRVVDLPSEREAFTAWLETQAVVLGRRPSPSRLATAPEDTWRGGFSYEDALQLIRRWRHQYDPMLTAPRWMAGTPALAPAPALSPPPVTSPVDQAMAAMVRSAHSSAARSGQLRTEVAKHKEVRFPTDDAFKAYLASLLEAQRGQCKLSGLPLQMGGLDPDSDMQPSLDRIDSSGHYEPGNLQIVCWFINRWKSDDSNANFVRLLRTVQGTSPAGS